jgi:hypothetical protein
MLWYNASAISNVLARHSGFTFSVTALSRIASAKSTAAKAPLAAPKHCAQKHSIKSAANNLTLYIMPPPILNIRFSIYIFALD